MSGGSIAKENRGFFWRADSIAGLAANPVSVTGAVGSSLILPALGTNEWNDEISVPPQQLLKKGE